MMRRMAGKQQTRAAHAAGYATVAEWIEAGSPPPIELPPDVLMAGVQTLDGESRVASGNSPAAAIEVAGAGARAGALARPNRTGSRHSFAQDFAAVLAEPHPDAEDGATTRQAVIVRSMVLKAESDPKVFELIADRVDGRAVQTVQTAGATSPEAMAELTTDAIFARLDALRHSVASRALSDGAVDGECSE